MLGELINLNIFSFFLIFARVGAAIMFLPGFSTAYVSVNIRLIIALGISFVMTPVLMSQLPGLPQGVIGMFLLLFGEIVIGGIFGMSARILTSALQTAGTIIALVSSMANALIRDPIAEQQSSLIASFLSTVAMTLIFVTDLHHLMIRGIIESYTLFIPGEPLPFADFSELMARRVADSFRLGLQLASPFVVSSLVFYIGIGILSRLMQTLPVFFVAMPLQIMGQMALLMLSLSTIMMVFLAHFEEGLIIFLEP